MGRLKRPDCRQSAYACHPDPDPDGHSDICGFHSIDRDGRIQKMNDTELAWLGYSRDDIVGHLAFEALLAPDSVARFRAGLDRLRQPGWCEEGEYELLCKDGSRLPVVVKTKAVRDRHGRILAHRSIVFDNRKRRQRQAALTALTEEQQRLDRVADAAIRARDSFIAHFSLHPFRLPST